jgi:hypothetical protein
MRRLKEQQQQRPNPNEKIQLLAIASGQRLIITIILE